MSAPAQVDTVPQAGATIWPSGLLPTPPRAGSRAALATRRNNVAIVRARGAGGRAGGRPRALGHGMFPGRGALGAARTRGLRGPTGTAEPRRGGAGRGGTGWGGGRRGGGAEEGETKRSRRGKEGWRGYEKGGGERRKWRQEEKERWGKESRREVKKGRRKERQGGRKEKRTEEIGGREEERVEKRGRKNK